MSIKFLLIFVGLFLAGAFTLYSQVQSFAGAFTGRRPAIYGLVSGILAALLGLGVACLAAQSSTVYWLLALIFFLFGAVHVRMTRERYFAPREDNFKITIGELFFAGSVLLFAVSVCAVLLYFFKDRAFLFFPVLLSTAAFFVPLLFLYLFRAAYTIPARIHPLWQYPDKVIPTPDIRPNEQLLVIGYEIAKNEQDARLAYFRAKALGELTLGEMYYHFLVDYNEEQSETPVQVRDSQGRPYEWWFRTRARWYQRARILDPGKDFRQNKVAENTVIICERIPV